MTDLTPLVDAVIGLPGLLVFAVVAVLLLKSKTIVHAHEQYVVTDGDEVDTVLESGLHMLSPVKQGNERVDVRTQTVDLPVEGVRTSDGVAVDVAVTGYVRVTDPAAAVVETDDYRLPAGSDVSDVQVAVTERMGDAVTDHVERRRWDELDGAEADLAAVCERDLGPTLSRIGVRLEEFEVDGIERSASK